MNKSINAPKVSVVIPTYNRADELRRCLDSLTRQTFKDFEVLVCDDGSTDETPEVTNSYKPNLDITYSYDENFGGPARPRNRGISLARAPFIAFLDSDDWWEPKKLETSLDYLNAGADVVFHDLWNVATKDQNVFKNKVKSHQPKSPVFNSILCSGSSIPNSSIVVRASILSKIGKISEDRELIAVEDFDMLLRLSKVSEKFKKIPQCLGYYWNGGNNISAASLRHIRRTEAVYKQHLVDLEELDRNKAEGILAYRIGRLLEAQGDNKSALLHYKRTIWSRGDLIFKIKASCLIFRIFLGRLYSRKSISA